MHILPILVAVLIVLNPITAAVCFKAGYEYYRQHKVKTGLTSYFMTGSGHAGGFLMSDIKHHHEYGFIDLASLVYFQTEKMKSGTTTAGTELYSTATAANLTPLNVTALDPLFDNPQFLATVPQGITSIIFAGTVMQIKDGHADGFEGGKDGRQFCQCLVRDSHNSRRWAVRICYLDREYDGSQAVVAVTKALNWYELSVVQGTSLFSPDPNAP